MIDQNLAAHAAHYEALFGCPAWSIALFVVLAAVYGGAQILQYSVTGRSGPESSVANGAAAKEASFRQFQWRWGTVYATIFLADWLQGTHMYALYQSYNLSKDNIGNLFLTGFGSGAVFSTIIGPIVDRFGRKSGCVVYCVLEVRRDWPGPRAPRGPPPAHHVASCAVRAGDYQHPRAA